MNTLIEILLSGLLIGALLIASYLDIKSREIPDYIPAGMIIASFSIQIIWSLITGAWEGLFTSLIVTPVYLVLALLLFIIGYWGGGDSKLLVGIAALFSNPIVPLFPLISPSQVLWFHPISLFLNVIIINSIFTVLYTIGYSLINTEIRGPMKKSIQFSRNESLFLIASACVIAIVMYILQQSLIFYILLPASLVLLFILFKAISFVEKQYFWKATDVLNIVEGDLLKDPIPTSDGQEIGGSSLGLTKEDIIQLRKLADSKHIPNEIEVRWGPPGAPSFLLSVLFTILFGDLISPILQFLMMI